MKVHILGVGNAFTPDVTSTSFLVEYKDGTYDLVDCGWGVFAKLKSLHEGKHSFKFSKLHRIFITHCHEDHIANLSSLLCYLRYYDLNTFVKIYANSRRSLSQYLDLNGHHMLDFSKRLKEIGTDDCFGLDSFLFNEDHLDNASFTLVDEDSCCVFTGDTKCTLELYEYLDKVIKRHSQVRDIAIFHDCQIYETDPPDIHKTPHATYKHILISYPQEWVDRYIWGVHYGTLPKQGSVLKSNGVQFNGVRLALEAQSKSLGNEDNV